MISHGTRWKYAFRAFFSLLFHGRLADDIVAAFAAPVVATAPAAAPDTTERAAQVLAILQRDGRLVDFLMEELGSYPDAQVGAAARDVHDGCRQALAKYATLTAVLDDEEGSTVT